MNLENVHSILKQAAIHLTGGECQICRYNTFIGAMEFHHLDPGKKDADAFFTTFKRIGQWTKLCTELKKCILLCGCCHREVHAGVTSIPTEHKRIPDIIPTLTEVLAQLDALHPCSVCQTPVPKCNRTCGPKCGATLAGQVDWESIDLAGLISSGLSFKAIARQHNIHIASVWKRRKKLGLRSVSE